MKYMLMMHAPRGTGDYQINSWSPDDIKAHMEFMFSLNRDLTKSGEVDKPERAYEIAAKASTAPGPGGVPLILPIEVRQIMSIRTPDA